MTDPKSEVEPEKVNVTIKINQLATVALILLGKGKYLDVKMFLSRIKLLTDKKAVLPL